MKKIMKRMGNFFKKIIWPIGNFSKVMLYWIIRFITKPGFALSDLILIIYKQDIDSVPFPWKSFVAHFHGHWAGFGLQQQMWKTRVKAKTIKIRKILLPIILVIIVGIAISFGSQQSEDNFLFGFTQNLLADIIFILLGIYILPKILNKQKKYSVTLQKEGLEEINDEYINSPYIGNIREEITLLLYNNGEEVYKTDEINWEINLSIDILEDIVISNSKSDIDGNSMRLYGANTKPLFVDQSLVILKANLKVSDLHKVKNIPQKIYYRLWTINGNIPTIENQTLDFSGGGAQLEDNPRLADLDLLRWRYNPEKEAN